MSQAATNIFTAVPVNVTDPVTPGGRASASNLLRASLETRGQNIQASAAAADAQVARQRIESQEKLAMLGLKADEARLKLETELRRDQMSLEQSLSEQQLAEEKRSNQEREKIAREGTEIERDVLAQEAAREKLNRQLESARLELEAATAAARARGDAARVSSQADVNAKVGEAQEAMNREVLRLQAFETSLRDGVAGAVVTLGRARRAAGRFAERETELVGSAQEAASELYNEAGDALREKSERGLFTDLVQGAANIQSAAQNFILGEQLPDNPFDGTPGANKLSGTKAQILMPVVYDSGTLQSLGEEAITRGLGVRGDTRNLYEQTISSEAEGGLLVNGIEKMQAAGRIDDADAEALTEISRISAALAYDDLQERALSDQQREDLEARLGEARNSLSSPFAVRALSELSVAIGDRIEGEDDDSDILRRIYQKVGMISSGGSVSYAQMGEQMDDVVGRLEDAVRSGEIPFTALVSEAQESLDAIAEANGGVLPDEVRSEYASVLARFAEIAEIEQGVDRTETAISEIRGNIRSITDGFISGDAEITAGISEQLADRTEEITARMRRILDGDE